MTPEFLSCLVWPTLFTIIGLIRLRCALRSNELLAQLVEGESR